MRACIEADNRLTLRRFHVGDREACVSLLGDYEVAKWLGQAPHPYGDIEFAVWMDIQAAAWRLGTAFPYAIALADGCLIGGCGLHPREGEPEFNLGYWIGRPYWGRGYASAAAAALTAAFDADHGPAALTSGYFLGNEASRKILTRLGFFPDGAVSPHPCLARGGSVPHQAMRRPAPMERHP